MLLSPFVLIVASMLNPTSAISISVQPSDSIEECQAAGKLTLAMLSQPPTEEGWQATYICHALPVDAAILAVIAYRKEQNKITIGAGHKPINMQACKIATMAMAANAQATGTGLSWQCLPLE